MYAPPLRRKRLKQPPFRKLPFDKLETATLEFRRVPPSLAFEFVEQSAARERARHGREDSRRAPRAPRGDPRAPPGVRGGLAGGRRRAPVGGAGLLHLHRGRLRTDGARLG